MSRQTVSIHYRRLPDREEVFEQALVYDGGEFLVTLLEAAPLERPVVVRGRAVLEPGAPVVWFTYPNRWHDIGRFHLADGTFTGFYANILTPVTMRDARWDTTDLALDVWVGADGAVEVLDLDEFTDAVSAGWIDERTASTARFEAGRIALAARAHAWPPAETREWTLERVRTEGG